MVKGVLHELPAPLPRKEHIRMPKAGIGILLVRSARRLWAEGPYLPLLWCCYCRPFGVPFGVTFAFPMGHHQGRLRYRICQRVPAANGL